jgi:pilus assembly protein Flp/PilA
VLDQPGQVPHAAQQMGARAPTAMAISVQKRRADLTSKESAVKKFSQVLKQLGPDEEGAALIEYTVLLGVLLVAVIATIGWVGGWVGGQWGALKANLAGTGAPAQTPTNQ